MYYALIYYYKLYDSMQSSIVNNEILTFYNDLPNEFLNNINEVAIDTEAMGLCPHRDRLCIAQFSKGDNISYIVQFNNYDSSDNIKSVLQNKNITKIFHYARFDVMMLYKYLGVMTNNIYCTKIASKLVRTYTDKHSLKDLCNALLGVEISKNETCTDWGSITLSKEQLLYAATDVLYLNKLKNKLDILLERENRIEIAKSCFDYLQTRVLFDLMVDNNYDIFAHH